MISRLNVNIPFQLTIIGGGRDEMKLKKLATDLNLFNKKIFFEGLKTNKEVYNFLSDCDFLLMNSRHETFSLICAEAMSCGKPVLATRCGGPEGFVTAEAGILIESDNDDQLLENFKYMLSHFKEYDSKKIIENTQKLFSMEKIVLLFHEVYSSARLKDNHFID